jgi:hypothetical protein
MEMAEKGRADRGEEKPRKAKLRNEEKKGKNSNFGIEGNYFVLNMKAFGLGTKKREDQQVPT